MVSTRISILLLAFGFSLSSLPAHAKGNAPNPPTTSGTDSSLVKASGGENDTPAQPDSMHFNTDTPAPVKDGRPTMRFTDPGDTPLSSPRPQFADTSPEEAPFTTYIGYPKNQFGAHLVPENISAVWNYNGNDYHFSNTTVAMGVDYRLTISPLWNLEFDYTNTPVKMAAATAQIYNFQSSSTALNTYFFKGHYCFVSRITFYRQICPGVDIGNDSYPIVRFLDKQNLQLSQVPDITIGVNVSYQEPISDRFLFVGMIGYNTGTGLGNSGTLTSKNNSSYFVKAGTDYTASEHNTVGGALVYQHRNAKLDGFLGNNEYNWTTQSSVLGFQINYLRSF